VRLATPADVGELALLRQRRDGGVLPELRSRFARALARPSETALLVVGLIDDQACGYGLAGRFEPPPDAPSDHAPAGWYLRGLLVRPETRRLGLGAELTRWRLEWLRQRTDAAYYFANSANLASIALHARFGFEEVSRDFWYPDVSFTGGQGVLFRTDLRKQERR
jgi:ribosomal protein S18 acetylase RimI-like enzyme